MAQSAELRAENCAENCARRTALRPMPTSNDSSSRYESGNAQPDELRMARCSIENHAPV